MHTVSCHAGLINYALEELSNIIVRCTINFERLRD
jgi:hypothetical protein